MATAPNNQLAKLNGNGSSDLAIIDERLKKQAAFLKMTLPYGKDLTDANAIALSVYCDTFGLNAQNGEAYFLVRVDANGSRREMGLYPGIKAWRKKAKEQLKAVDNLANYKIDYEVIPPSELGVPKTKENEYAICVRARLTDDVSRSRYLAQMVQLLSAGLKLDQIEAIIGKPPFWIGYGSVKTSELNYAKMEPLRLAEKRAEKDATSRRFDLPFADEEMAEDVDPSLPDENQSPKAGEQPKPQYRSEAAIMKDLGYGDMPTQEGEFHDAVEPGIGEPETEASATLFDPGPENHYSDLDEQAKNDPKTATRRLATRIGWKAAEVEALSKENGGDWAKTYQGLRKNAPPAN